MHLVCPAGSPPALKAAVDSGADAVTTSSGVIANAAAYCVTRTLLTLSDLIDTTAGGGATGGGVLAMPLSSSGSAVERLASPMPLLLVLRQRRSQRAAPLLSCRWMA